MIDGHGDDRHLYGGISINFSSNIYAHADLSELREHLAGCLDVIGSYPEPAPLTLESLIARTEGIEADQVLVTSGATDAIYLLAQTFCHMQAYEVKHPTFSEYDDACRLFGMSEGQGAPVCWVCNPNNPTGTVCPPDELKQLARRHQLLIVDQSYEDYTLAPLLSPQEAIGCGNIILIHSMTKRYAVPGLRLGYLTAPAPLLSEVRRHCRPWAVNALAIEAGKWLLQRRFRLISHLSAYLDEAQRLGRRLGGVEGISVMPTQTNFMLCTIEQATAAELKQWLAHERGMLIRDASNFRSLTPHHFRVAAGLPCENSALVKAIHQFLSTK